MDTEAFLRELVARFDPVRLDEQGWDSLALPDFDAWLGDATGNQITDRFNELGIAIARRYHAREYTFLFGDWLINLAYAEMITSTENFEYPVLFDEIYQAFDDGEWSHSGKWYTEQPVITYTDPAIAAIVARLDQAQSNLKWCKSGDA